MPCPSVFEIWLREAIMYLGQGGREMRILYISALPKTKSGGPRYSVPQQIAAQAKYDDVYWINLTPYGVDDSEIPCNTARKPFKCRVSNLYAPFNNPDLVVFEDVYYLEFCLIGLELRRHNIPYIIIPRGALTESAQEIKSTKKKIANLLIFRDFIRNAIAIQYLTEGERSASGKKWNENSVIIPNGIRFKERTKVWRGSSSLRGIFIGRMNMYHKGLDYLMEACVQLRNELIDHECTIDLYGPDRLGAKEILADQIKANGLEEIVSIRDEVYGREKEEALLRSDFFILTSRFEGQPMGLLEALSYGLPCLVTTGSNMADEVLRANAGWTADISVGSIVDAFKDLLSDKKQLEEKGRNALALSRQYEWDTLGKMSSEKYGILATRARQK